MNTDIKPQNLSDKKLTYVIPAEIPRGNFCYRFTKRVIDVMASFTVGVILLMPSLIIALMIKFDSKGPALFKQERFGLGGKRFYIYKFRTMHLGAERYGPQWATVNDGRCTRLGRYLRKCKIDEIPQLWNIFKGDMTFVGPRPERPYFYNEFETYIHGFRNRLVVKPGLTGLAQVNGGYDLKPEEKIYFDMEYIRTRSLWLDFKLIIKTVKVVFTRRGTR